MDLKTWSEIGTIFMTFSVGVAALAFAACIVRDVYQR